MALINRVSISNVLNFNGEKSSSWKPVIEHIILDLMGQSAAMNLVNGGGKTTIADALIGLISRDRTLLSKTYKKLCPSKERSWSHIQVELVSPKGNESQDDLFNMMGEEVAGETYVFGMCGYKESGSRVFYHYRGTLEEMPVGIRLKNGVSLVSNIDFKENRPSKVSWSVGEAEWHDEIKKHFIQDLNQLVQFQKNGGGDKSANLFNFKPQRGENPEHSFFYEVIAPEIMSNMRAEQTEEGEYLLEGQILESIHGLLNSKHKLKKKKQKLDSFQDAVESLSPVETSLKKTLQEQSKYESKLSEIASDIYQLKEVVVNDPVIGIPDNSVPDTLMGQVLMECVIDPDKGFLVTDQGLSKIINDKVSDINRRANRNKVYGSKSTEVIDFKSHNYRNSSKVGPKPTNYSIEDAKKIIASSSKFHNGLNKETAKELIESVEACFKESIDTNLFRKEVEKVNAEILKICAQIDDLQKNEIDILDEQIKEYESQIANKDANQTAYNELVDSELFSLEELEKPIELESKVQEEVNAAEKELITFSNKQTKLEDLRYTWTEFAEKYPERLPVEVQAELLKQERLAKEDYKFFQDKCTQVCKDKRSYFSAYKTAKTKLAGKCELQEGFKPFLQGVDIFNRIFGEAEPKGLAQKLTNNRRKLRAELKALSNQIKEEAKNSLALDKFRSHKEINDESLIPEQWLDKIKHERSEIVLEIESLSKKRAELHRQINDLKNESISANQYIEDGLEHLRSIGLDFISLNQLIMEEPSFNGSQKQKLLSSYSAMLFSPVFSGYENAKKAVTFLDQKSLQIPVLVKSDFINFANNEKFNIKNESGLFVGSLAGIKTRQVNCLLNPELIPNEIKEIQSQLLHKVKPSLLKAIKRQQLISENSELILLANQAQKAIDNDSKSLIVSLPKEIDSKLPTMRKLVSQTVPKMLSAIEDMQMFSTLGGKDQYDELAANILSLNADIKDFKTKLRKYSNRKYSDRKKLETLDKECKDAFPQDLKNLLENAIYFYQEGGPEFFRDFDTTKETLDVNKTNSDNRNSYKLNFEKAQNFLDSDSDQAKTQEVLGELIKTRDHHQEKIDNELLPSKRTLRDEELPPLVSMQKRVDHLARLIQSQYREVMSHEGSIDVTDSRSDEFRFIEACNQLKKLITADADELEVFECISEIEDQVTAIDISDKIELLSGYKRSCKSSLINLKDHCNHSLRQDGFAPPERERMQAVLEVPENDSIPEEVSNELSQLILKVRESYGVFESEYNKAKEAFEVSFENTDSHLASLIQQTSADLVHLKRVMRANKSKNHKVEIHIDADTASKEQIRLIIERIMLIVDSEVKHRNDDIENNLPHKNEKEHKNNLKKKIRDSIYRDLFKNPSVQFIHTQIRPHGKKFSISEGLSEGQKTSLSLVMTIKLAEFAIVREAKKLAPTHARKAINKSESVLIIDGLFSNLSDPELIASAMDGIEATRGRFQLIGLIHNPTYQNNFDVFPVYLIGKRKYSDRNSGWLSFDNKSNGVLDMADIVVKKREAV